MSVALEKEAESRPVADKSVTRQVERDYLARLGRLLDDPTWQAICNRAIEQAMEGDYRARDWLSRYVMPRDTTLLDIASEEARGKTSAKLIKEHREPVFRRVSTG